MREGEEEKEEDGGDVIPGLCAGRVGVCACAWLTHRVWGRAISSIA